LAPATEVHISQPGRLLNKDPLSCEPRRPTVRRYVVLSADPVLPFPFVAFCFFCLPIARPASVVTMAFVGTFGPAVSSFTGQRVGASATCAPAGCAAVPARRTGNGAGAGGLKAVISTPRPASTAPGVKIATPMTLTEKILAKAAERGSVRPGDNIWVNTDVLMTHDVCGPGTIGVFKREFGEDAKVWDTEKVVIIPDHYIFTEDVRANRNVDILRDFVNEQGIKYFYDIIDRSDYKVVRLSPSATGLSLLRCFCTALLFASLLFSSPPVHLVGHRSGRASICWSCAQLRHPI